MNLIYKKIFQFAESTLNLLPTFILFTLSVLVVIVVYQSSINFDQLIQLLRVLIWPAIVLSSLLFFRKVFTYLFFSFEEFNFFGAKGKLKNVRSVIAEKAEDLYQLKLEQEAQEKERLTNEQELQQLRESNEGLEENHQRLFELTERVIDQKSKLVEENRALKKKLELRFNNPEQPTAHELQIMIEDLLAQVSSLQKQVDHADKSS